LILFLRRDSASARGLTDEQPFLADGRADGAASTLFPKRHDKSRVDDRRVSSGISFFNRNGLRWCDAPKMSLPGQWMA